MNGEMTPEQRVAKLAPSTQLRRAAELLLVALPADGEWHLSQPIYEVGRRAALHDRLLRRAANAVGIETIRRLSYQGGGLWRWPPTDEQRRLMREAERATVDVLVDEVLRIAPGQRCECDRPSKAGGASCLKCGKAAA